MGQTWSSLFFVLKQSVRVPASTTTARGTSGTERGEGFAGFTLTVPVLSEKRPICSDGWDPISPRVSPTPAARRREGSARPVSLRSCKERANASCQGSFRRGPVVTAWLGTGRPRTNQLLQSSR